MLRHGRKHHLHNGLGRSDIIFDIIFKHPFTRHANGTHTIKANAVYSLHNMDHAIHSAEIFSQCNPMLVGTGGLVLFPDTPLLEEAECGEFDPLLEMKMLIELKTFVEHLTFTLFFLSFRALMHTFQTMRLLPLETAVSFGLVWKRFFGPCTLNKHLSHVRIRLEPDSMQLGGKR